MPIPDPAPDPKDPVLAVPVAAVKRKRTEKTCLDRPNAKKSKKESVRRGLISEVRVSKLEASQLKSLKLTNFEKSKELVELSPLVRKFENVPDGEKIPCVSEQSSMFKFMYLLKKSAGNLKYFYKYTIIECSGRLVAIKPFNVSQVTREYLTEVRLDAIRRILEQIAVS